MRYNTIWENVRLLGFELNRETRNQILQRRSNFIRNLYQNDAKM